MKLFSIISKKGEEAVLMIKKREEKKITKTKLSLKLELMAIYLSRHDIYKIEKNDLPVKE